MGGADGAAAGSLSRQAQQAGAPGLLEWTFTPEGKAALKGKTESKEEGLGFPVAGPHPLFRLLLAQSLAVLHRQQPRPGGAAKEAHHQS